MRQTFNHLAQLLIRKPVLGLEDYQNPGSNRSRLKEMLLLPK
jgi:hypothetical protein